MILLGYIILGHPDWKRSQIKIFALFDEKELEEQRKKLFTQIASGRLPISTSNVMVVPYGYYADMKQKINETSVVADLTLLGFDHAMNHEQAEIFFRGFDNLGNVLFVNSSDVKAIE